MYYFNFNIVTKKSYKLCVFGLIACVLLYMTYHHESVSQNYLRTRIDKILNLKEYSPRKWLLLKSNYMETCHAYAEIMTNWTVLCITSDTYNKRFSNEKILHRKMEEILRMEMSLFELSLDSLYYYFAIKQGARSIFMLNSKEIENHTQFMKSLSKFNDEYLTGLLYNATHVNNYTKQPFNSSVYYGCYSIEEYDDINDTHRFPLHCYDGIIPAIYTPAYFESSKIKTERCDRRMPDIVVPENNFVYYEFDKTIYSTCSFWFLPVFEPTLKDNHGSGERFYKCFVQWALWQLDCYISVYWQNYLTHDFETLNVSSYCQKFIESFTSCKNLTIDIEKCILKNARIYFSNDSITKLTHWFEALNLLNFQLKRSDSTSVCLTNSSMILHPVRHHSFDNHIEYNNANFNISQLYYAKTCSENVSAFMNLTKVINLAKPWIQQQQPNVLLLIVFNYPHFEIIPLLESIHRPLYPYILYCGSERLKRNLTLLYRLSFVTYNQPYGHNAGAFNYQCIIKAIRMGYDLDGIFLIADDIFIKTELIKVPTKNNKFCTGGILGNLKSMKQCSSLTNCSNPMTWIWWGGFRSGLHRMFWDWNELGERHPNLKLALQRLQNVTGGEMRMYGNTGDIA